MERQLYVYILTNDHETVLYTGVTNNLERWLAEHRTGATPGFTSRYRAHRLVYFEVADAPRSAIQREKELKGWSRAKKVALIEGMNPHWRDLSADLGFAEDVDDGG